MTPQRLAIAALSCGLVLLAGCATGAHERPYAFRSGLPVAPNAPAEDAPSPATSSSPVFQETRPPSMDIRPGAVAGLRADDELPPMGNTPVSINVQDVPVPVLANEIFGNLLGLNVNMAPEVSSLESLVTLNTRNKVRPRELFQLARQVLAEYGVAVSVEGDLVRLHLAAPNSSIAPPLIVSGRALPDVPISHRPVFQLVELEVVRSGDAMRWLTTLYGQELKITEESNRNALLISGKPSQVKQAVDALRVFDRPLMRGRLSSRIEPAFLSAEQLAVNLMEVLNIQGYSASRSAGAPASVLVLPVQAANSVLIFATTKQGLDYAIEWARELDRPGQQAGSSSMFYYQVKNTKAADLAAVLSGNQPSGGSDSASPSSRNVASRNNPADPDGAPAAAAPAARAGAQPAGNRGGGNAIVGSQFLVDEPRNALIYQGDPVQWERMLTLIRQMDRAPRQVMIEVTVAEVSLTDDTSFGLTWFARNGFGRFDGRGYLGSGSGGANSGPGEDFGGLTYLLDVAGQNRVALTAFANDNRVSILSTPRLLVKSGSEANIDVGTEVPTISMTTTSNQQTGGNTNLLQSVQYRRTGLILNIKPTVYSDDRIDLDIAQEVSEALPLETGATANSPSIFNRSLNTSLSLRDGGSVVMAGLISDRQTNSDSGVPLLKDIPVLGNLFKSKGIRKNRTELVLIIVPYIVESDDRIQQLSQAVIDQFELLEMESVLLPPAQPGPGAPGPQTAPATPHLVRPASPQTSSDPE